MFLDTPKTEPFKSVSGPTYGVIYTWPTENDPDTRPVTFDESVGEDG